MKKFTIFLITQLVSSMIFFSGCNEQKDINNTNSNLPNGDQNNTSKPSEESPDPYFPTNVSYQELTYTPEGTSTGITVGIEVKNGGKAGEVFVSVACAKKEWYASKVFYMDENENVTVKAHFNVTISPYTYQSYKWDWIARAALQDDTSQGDVYIERSN